MRFAWEAIKPSILLFYPSFFHFTAAGPRLGLRVKQLSPVFLKNYLWTGCSTESFYSTAFGESPMLLDNASANKMRAKQH